MSDLVGNPEDQFSHVVAHIILHTLGDVGGDFLGLPLGTTPIVVIQRLIMSFMETPAELIIQFRDYFFFSNMSHDVNLLDVKTAVRESDYTCSLPMGLCLAS